MYSQIIPSSRVKVPKYVIRDVRSPKLPIKKILPLALSLILPGLSLYSNSEWIVLDNLMFSQKWIIGSFIMYIWWSLLWYINHLKSKYTRLYFILFILFFQIVVLPVVLTQLEFTIDRQNLARSALATILFMFIQSTILAQENIARLRLEKEQIQTENYKAQLKALRNRIDPHFLFNSLNTLRSMVRHQHRQSEEFVMSLSDFYRQILKHNENTSLPLSEELMMLQSYLFLMKSRNEDAVQDCIQVDKSLYTYHVPTLALQVVVENCFKHNSMTARKPLYIHVFHTQDSYIVVQNNRQAKIGKQEESGYGLELLRKRYDLLKVADGLLIEKTADHFTVKLKLLKP